MGEGPDTDTRGIVNPERALGAFRLTRVSPAPDLARFVDRHWAVEWDLRGREPFVQDVLPHPTVHLAVDPRQAAVFGVVTGRFTRTLAGQGRVVGTKFRPGGFAPFASGPVADLTDREVPLGELFGDEGEELAAASLAATGVRAAARIHEDFLRSRLPERDPVGDEVARIVEQMLHAPPATRLEDLAAEHAVSVRTLQRRFRDYVGVGPKWVLQRYRLHDAAERIATGAAGDWARLGADLGYFDQAHFVNDFREAIGSTPAEYAAECEAARARLAAWPSSGRGGMGERPLGRQHSCPQHVTT